MKLLLPFSLVILCCVSCRTETAESHYVSLSVDYSHLTDEYVQRIESADSSAEVAQALNAYTEKVGKILPQLVALTRDHPELIQHESGVLRDAQSRVGEVSGKLGTSFLKIAKFMDDPEVESAQWYLMEVMQVVES